MWLTLWTVRRWHTACVVLTMAKTKKHAPGSDTNDEAIFDLPKREAMSLLPSGLGSLPGGTGGLGGGILGGGTPGTTPPPHAGPLPPTPIGQAPPMPEPSLSPDAITGSGAAQTAPIAQQSSKT